jgi:hypothetical protein
MVKSFIIAFLASIVLGFILTSPYLFALYLILLPIAVVIALIVIIWSFVYRKPHWKMALLCLAAEFSAILISQSIQSYLNSQYQKKREQVISELYNYRNKYGHFPSNEKELSNDLSSLNAHFIPDSTLQSFKLYTRGMYGFPWDFSSKDSTWER